MDQAEADFDMTYSPTMPRRDSAYSMNSKRLSIASDSWPTTPHLPHTPTAFIFPRSSSGQSIPIFFDADDVVDGQEDVMGRDGEVPFASGKENYRRSDAREGKDHSALQQPPENLEMNRLSSTYSSSSASSRCFSIDSRSVTSVSTAPTEPPSPSPLSPCEVSGSPPSFDIPLPLPIPTADPPPSHFRSQSHHPLLNARRKVVARPGTAPTAGRQRSFSSSPSSSAPCVAPRPQHSHHCLTRRGPPRSPDSTACPPPDAFFDPSSSSRPSTSSTFEGSVQAIPIRLVPPTPTPSDRAIKLQQRELYRAPSSPLLSTKEARAKPLPSLPIFPTRPSPPTTSRNRVRTACVPPPLSAPTHARNRSRSEGVYNVPVFPPCVYPPSPPRPSPPSPRSPPRVKLASKFSYRHLRRDHRPTDDDAYSQIESIPLIARGARGKPPRTASSTLTDATELTSVCEDAARFVAGETSLQLLIDQEGFRDAKVDFVYTGEDAETGLLEFVAKRPEAGLEREGYPFHAGFLQTPPHLRRLHLNGNDAVDYLRREASLSIGNKDGVYKVSSHSKIDLDLAQGGKDIEGPYFSFAYETKRRLNLVGRPMKGERLLRPLVFVCSREFLDPRRGRKIGFLHLVSRTFTLPTSASLVVRKQKSVSALKLKNV
ncbi:hypothetical protein JCM11491_004234 [Sporobolomyces phaffii]